MPETRLSILTRALIAMAVIVLGTGLLYNEIPVPDRAWILAFVAILGAQGADIIYAIARVLRNGREINNNGGRISSRKRKPAPGDKRGRND